MYSSEEMDMFFGDIPHPATEPPEDIAPDEAPYDGEAATEAKVSVAAALVDVFADLHRRAPEKVAHFADAVRNEPTVLAALDDDARDAVDGFCQLLERSAAHTSEAAFDMRYLPSKRAFSARVVSLHEAVCNRIGSVEDAYLTWNALLDELRIAESRRAAQTFIAALSAKDNPDALAEAHQKVAASSPVRAASAAKRRVDRRATAVYEEWSANQTGTSGMRLSCGLASIDVALTPKGRPVGFIAPGEQVLMAGDTGTGKTSMCYAIAAAMTNDVIAWGLPDGLVVLVHTEEEEKDKIEGMRMAPGQRFSHLGNNLVVQNVGTSRQAVVTLLYDLVMDADERSGESGRPITDFLPYVVILDYIQALSEVGETEVVSTQKSAEFIMRGVQAWNPEELYKFSGVSFADYAGYEWPAGMERHRVAVVTFAQLIKIDSRTNFYDPNSKSPLTDFALEYQDGDPVVRPWTGPDGRQYCWEVKPGDARLLGRNEVRGHGQILQNATALLFLHRSRPTNNPKVGDHLQDRRARIQLGKTRNGSGQKFVPLEFDLQPDGPKAQYFDPTGFAAVQQGTIAPNDIFTQYGDPICPRRGEKDPFADVNYLAALTTP